MRLLNFTKILIIDSISFQKDNPNILKLNPQDHNKVDRLKTIYPETEIACKHKTPLFKTHFSEILVEYEKNFDMKTGKLNIHPNQPKQNCNNENFYIPVTCLKNAGIPGEKLRPQDKDSIPLQELSLMNNKFFGAIHFDIHLDKKLGYTISRIFQEMSKSELETLHHLCKIERTQRLQSLALAVLKLTYAGYLLTGNRLKFIDYVENGL